MISISKSDKTYISMIGIMLIGKAIWMYYRLNDPLVQRSINSCGMMLFVSVIGFIGLKLAQKTDFPDIWDKDISNKQRIIIPAFYGVFFALIQIILVTVQNMKIPMVSFPLSVPVYMSVGILSEIVLHFVPVVFLYWLVANIILKNKWKVQVFWAVAILVSLWEPILQILVMHKMGMLNNLLMAVLPFILVFAANIIPITFLRKYGFLSAVIWRLSNYLLWHIIWGGFFM